MTTAGAVTHLVKAGNVWLWFELNITSLLHPNVVNVMSEYKAVSFIITWKLEKEISWYLTNKFIIAANAKQTDVVYFFP